jgi:hypothetical protein
MAESGPSSHRARPCSFGDFLQISIVLHLWPIEPVDRKCNTLYYGCPKNYDYWVNHALSPLIHQMLIE